MRLLVRRVWFAVLVCITVLNAQSNAQQTKPPNVLFIAVDDLRPELNCYGKPHVVSPNIDRLASSGFLFERAYCQQSVCNPSRTSLMTGMRPDSIGVTGNHSHFRTDHPNVVTLPQHFKNHGYFAKAIGKLYHGVFPEGSSKTKWDTMGDPESWSVPATRFGPRYYYTEEGIAAAKASFLETYRPNNPGPDDWTQKLVFGTATESPDVSDNTLYDGMVADSAIKALQELKQNPNQPFFLAVGFIKPHSPYIAPKKYFDLYTEVDIATEQDLPKGAPDYAGHGSGELRRYTDQPDKGPIPEEKQKRVRRAYYACVSYIDAQIGRVLDELDRLGLAENTIVSLYGDHGYHLGEQGLWGKTTNFELDTRVPLIVRVPGMETKGQTSSSLVELVDLYPTLVELAGLPLIDQLEGKSFAPILADPTSKTKDFALSQYPRGDGLMGYSIRSSTHRLTQWVNAKTAEVRSTELYEYSGGKTIETKNLANEEEYKPRIDFMSKQLFTAIGQRVTKAEIIPLTLPALVGTPASALVKLRIDTEGVIDPIAVTELTTSLEGTTDLKDLDSVQIYYGGTKSDFSSASLFGKKLGPKGKLVFVGNQTLAGGANYFWVACTLEHTANIDHYVAAACSQITFSDGQKKALSATPSIERMGVAVRNGGDDGVHTFRIPGLATTNKGSLIGVYDIRREGAKDLPGNIDVGMSRSADGGRNWDPMKVIMDMGDDPKWKGDGIGDPAVMVDRKTGTIWVSATWSHGNRSWFGSGPGLAPEETGQWIMVKSDDDGLTWSKPINITKQVKKPEWSFLLQGPGKGITLSDEAIVFPAQYQDPPNANDKQVNRLPHSSFIFSRDHGDSWQMATGAWDDTTEAQVVELADGEIMINCRNNRASQRAILTTNDMGMTWEKHPTHVKDLIEPGSCMASLINVGRELAWRDMKFDYDNNFLLFSNPNSLRGRNHMTIKASMDAGMTWPVAHQLLLDEQGGAGYSCLSMIDSETVGILYEGSQAQMTFQRVKISDILNPPKDQKTKNPALSVLPRSTNNELVARPRNSEATLSVARVFGDHMVLQVDQPIRVWGKAKPGSAVSVSLGRNETSVSTDSTGKWIAKLPKQKQNPSPQSLVVKSGDATVELKDILIGEVWFCAGQSNMEWPLSKTANAKRALAESVDTHLRLLNFVGAARGGSGIYNETHFSRIGADQFSQGAWAVSGPQSAKDFSGVGYYFAQHLRKHLNCPIGIINVSIGGTPIESWVSQSDLSSHPQLSPMVAGNWLDNPVLDDWCKKRARSNLKRGLSGELNMPSDETGPNHSFKPGFMFAAGVEPFLPMSIKGVLWYQGESNADNRQRIEQYDMAFPLLVSGWRSAFQNPKMPVAFVQLPAMGRPNWPRFREYQRRSLNKLQNVGMAITIDVGHRTNVHPQAKQPVGERLAVWALARTYGRSGPATGPLFQSKSIVGDSIVVTFASVGDGLQTTDSAAPIHFEIAGADKIFHPATARIEGHRITLTSASVKSPVHARYAWVAFPKPTVNLINSAGLPASPFTTEEEF